MTPAADTVSREAPASRMNDVFDNAPVPALVLDADGKIEAANVAASRMLGTTEAALTGRAFTRLTADDGQTVPNRSDGPFAASVWVGELDDGSAVVQLVESSGRTPEQPQTGATLEEQRAFRSALLELSELSHSRDDDARFYDTLLRRAVDVVPGAQAGSVLVHRAGTDEYHFVAAQGFDLDALQERCLYEHHMFRDVETAEATINRDVASMPLPPDQSEWLARAGRIREILTNVSVPVFVAGQPVAFISLDNFDDREAFNTTSVEMTTVLGRLIADLLRRRELEAEVRRERESFRHLAMHDGLTGLANRRHIETALAEVGSDADPRLAVFFVDIDDFKHVNDEYGHDAGDEIIVAVADALQRSTRPDDLVGRWGGDEFLVIARGITCRDDVAKVADRVLGVLDSDIVLDDGREVTCHLSIGAAWRSDDAIATNTLVRRADAALYDAKHGGKHTVRITDL